MLHYVEKDKELAEEIVLITGAEFEGYAGDITRTFSGQWPLLQPATRCV